MKIGGLPISLVFYQILDGKIPFNEWFNSLKSEESKQIVDARMTRLQDGNLGDHKSLRGGIYELRIHFSQGFRIYFGKRGEQLVVLLVGGEKKTQEKDILRAEKYWQDFKARSKSRP